MCFFLRREFIIFDSLTHDLGSTFYSDVVHKISVCDRLFKLVCEVWFALLHLEYFVCAAVHLITWSGGKSDKQTVEVVEDGSVFAENGAVSLVYDDEVESAYGECLVFSVDVVDHRLVCGECQSRVQIMVAVVAQHTRRHIWQQLDEILVSLVYQ